MAEIPLFNNIKKEILEDTYLSSRINVAAIENSLVEFYKMEELHNVNDKDYLFYIALAFSTMDIVDFFLFPTWERIEEQEEYLLEKVELNNLSRNTAKRIFWTEYAVNIILYLELDFQIPNIYKQMLIKVLKKIIELYSTYEEFAGTLKEIGKAYTYFFRKYKLKEGEAIG